MYKKFPSIENDYNQKNLRWWIEHYPVLGDPSTVFMLTEKIHGANFQVNVTSGGIHSVCSRRQEIPESPDAFHGIWSLIQSGASAFLLHASIRYCQVNQTTIRWYGEVFGGRIQKGVNYGTYKQVRYFGVQVGEKWWTDKQMHEFVYSIGLTAHMLAPVVGLVTGLENALNAVDVETFRTTLHPRGDVTQPSIAEGVVLTPYDHALVTEQGSRFAIKMKATAFKEVQRAPKVRKVDDDVEAAHAVLEQYVTESRVRNVVSHGVPLESPKQFGQLIRDVISDAVAECENENPGFLDGLDKGQRGQATNFGKQIVDVLKDMLNE